tara:strand:- start:2582 stop:3604 length:1023 start_codon:yes stop_codon:yes gene_type:complete
MESLCIYGFGSVGKYIYSKLNKSKINISISDKKFDTEISVKNNLLINANKIPVKIKKLKILDESNFSKKDIIFLCLKSNDIFNALPILKKISNKKTLFIFTQNDVPYYYLNTKVFNFILRNFKRNDEINAVYNFFKNKKTIHCIVNAAIKKKNYNVSKVVYEQKLFIGSKNVSINKKKKLFSKIFNPKLISFNLTNEIEPFLWGKLIGVIGSHGLSTISNKTFIQLYKDKHYKKLLRKLFLEADKIREKLKIKSLMNIEKRMKKVAKVGSHKSSMHYDFINKQKSEFEFSYGIMTELIKYFKIRNSIIKKLYICLQRLENLKKSEIKAFWKKFDIKKNFI